MNTNPLKSAARRAGDHPVIEYGARLGYAVNGLLHLLIAWLGVQLAVGTRSGSADQSGAMSMLASTTMGKVTLVLGIAGFALLALWQITELLVRGQAGDKVKAASKAVLYLALAFSCWGFLDGAGSDSSQQTASVTAGLMSKPAGRILVAAVGLTVLGVGIYHVVKGVKKRFLQDLQDHPGRLVVLAGQVGYSAKGVALLIVGLLFLVAAWHRNAAESTGLDGALRTLLGLPLGVGLVLVVAVGFAAYAAYSFARAKHARV